MGVLDWDVGVRSGVLGWGKVLGCRGGLLGGEMERGNYAVGCATVLHGVEWGWCWVACVGVLASSVGCGGGVLRLGDSGWSLGFVFES